MEKKRILIIDDEKNFGEMVKVNLEMDGVYDVRAESEGGRGLAAVREFRPHLILLDVIMRDMSGPAVAQQIRQEPDLRRIPIIFLTAMTEADIPSDKFGGEKFELIQKPVSVEDLIGKIETRLSKEPS